MEVLKLVKLLYLADRKSIELRGVPIFGGSYFSLPHGPITSEGLDLINGKGRYEDQILWDKLISERNGNLLTLRGKPTAGEISKSEIKILVSVFEQHGQKTASALRNWCHDNVKEYEETSGSVPITLKEIGLAVGMDPEVIAEEAEAYRFLENALAY
jgi:uncharacterized phage-associated protein